MLKNKFKIITILFVIILALTLPVVRAENEIAENTSTTPTTESSNTTTEVTNNSTDESFKRGDVYLVGDNVTIDYIVDGNLFVVANNVTINSQIGGDAFICANTVTVEEQGYIFSNLFTFSKNVNVNGVVYDLYSASETTTIKGYVYRDIRVGSNTVNIFGTIGRNAYVSCSGINFSQDTDVNNEETNFTSQGMINGNLEYSAKEEISIPESSVTGETTFKQELVSDNDNTIIQEQFLSLGVFVVTIIVIWLLCLWLAPKFLNNANKLITEKLLPVIGFGFLTPIVITILFILLLILGITSKIALLSLGILLLLIAISSSISVICINDIICNKFKIEKTIVKLGILVVSSIVIWLLTLIPYVGGLISFILTIVGLGIIAISIIPARTKKKENKNIKDTKKE